MGAGIDFNPEKLKSENRINSRFRVIKNFLTKTGILFIRLTARLPFRILYGVSDLLYPLVYYVIQYRKKVVLENLRHAFPEKNETEIRLMARKFYRHFCDLMLESLKVSGMSDNDFRERMKIGNPELADRFFQSGRSIVALTMHYNNWEWGIFMTRYVRHRVLAVYKPLHNALFDRFMKQTRSKYGTELVSNEQILRRIVKAEKVSEKVCTWLAGDQTPSGSHKYWFRFLNREAMFHPGPAFISKRFNHPVLFMKIEKTGRGKYLTTLEMLCENPAETTDSEIIQRYIDRMEEIIREKPEYYLWSHRRWKHRRPKGVPLKN